MLAEAIDDITRQRPNPARFGNPPKGTSADQPFQLGFQPVRLSIRC
jgi:hypothetical protein